jgi:Na+/H+ antiporter NhaC
LRRDKAIDARIVPKKFAVGLKGMIGVSLVIIFATGLSEVSTDLGTGAYVADVFADFITPQLLPALIFVLSMVITVATGFSWSSMAIVMPIAFQMAMVNQVPEFIPVISAAVISGAVSGEHMIPYSEKAVMTSAACKITPIYHIKTHILQALLVFGAATGGYLLIGYGWHSGVAYGVAIGVILLFHFVFARENSVKYYLKT